MGIKSFIEGTLVLTSIGLVKIEDIRANDEVWSYNEETKEKELKKVKQVFRNKTKEWLHLKVVNEETQKEENKTCTKSHRIYVKNKGWIEAINILENDIVLMYNNIQGRVINKELQILDHFETTYNFEVEDNHNYYVSDECVLVHNQCALDTKKTNKEIKAMSEKKGYKKVNGISKVKLIFKNDKVKRNLRFITYDNTAHNGGTWKATESIKKLGSKSARRGTYDELLNWIHE